jgi:hypothetical protein
MTVRPAAVGRARMNDYQASGTTRHEHLATLTVRTIMVLTAARW